MCVCVCVCVCLCVCYQRAAHLLLVNIKDAFKGQLFEVESVALIEVRAHCLRIMVHHHLRGDGLRLREIHPLKSLVTVLIS